MKRNFIQTTVIAAAISITSVQSQALDLFGWLKADKNSIESMMEYIPASTPLFFGSISTKEMVVMGDDMLEGMDLRTMGKELSSMVTDLDDGPTAEFVAAIIDDYYATASEGGMAVMDRYGLDPEGASVVYLNGIFPVMRVAVEDESAFIDYLTSAAQVSNFELSEKSIKDQTLTTIRIENNEDQLLSIGFLVADGILTISAFTHADNDGAIALRFGLDKPAQALSEETWESLEKQYDYDEYLRGYLSFIQMAEAFFNEDSLAKAQLEALSGESIPMEPSWSQCKPDVMSLVAGVPRVVFGAHEVEAEDGVLSAKLNYTTEIKHSKTLDQLTMLEGFLPSYVVNNENLVAGFALGLDINKLTPVLTELWTMFTTAEFECDALIEMQQNLQSTSPAILAMFTGMAQGLHGSSIGIFDVIADDTLPMGGSVDAIVTVSTEKPELLISLLTSYVPMFQGFEIPTDGTPVSLEEIGIPMPVYVALKGNHIVVYSGEKSADVATSIESEALEKNGLASFSLSYPGVADLMLSAAIPYSQYQVTMGSGEECTELYTAALMMGQIPLQLSATEGFTEQGFSSSWSINMDMTNLQSAYGAVDGEYRVSYLDYDCSWVSAGGEVINNDGTGRYFDYDETNSCESTQLTYSWVRQFNAIKQTGEVYQYRDTCESEWVEEDPFDFNCTILTVDQGGFYCLDNQEDEQTLYRYNRH
ncbi:hypothetical protein KO489_01980 [Reinekea forsetii]|nr:hypothetical protein [Reinekea forsetii]